MPVGTNASVKGVSKDDLAEIGFEIILANTYHLYLRPGADILEKAGGLHGFSGWNKNFLTDSGGFQVFSLAPFRKITNEGVRFQSHIDGSRHVLTPESVADIQARFNSDIQMQLDVCTGYGITEKKAVEALRITENWARRAKAQWEKRRAEGYEGMLFPIVQGNFFKDLRIQSAEFVASLDLPGIAIGGLSVGEPYELYCEMLAFTASLLPPHKVRYVMGIGTPEYILTAVANGIDMFDCVMPTRNGRNAMLFTYEGTMNMRNKKWETDFSPVDSNGCDIDIVTSKAYLHHLFKAGELLAMQIASIHNLAFYLRLVTDARAHIEKGDFTQWKSSIMDKLGRRL